jgi:acetyl esterase/lipase
MGSGYFYLEFLLAWLTLLSQAGFRNPAILALEYSLVPEAVYPTQLDEALSAYRYALSITNGDASRVCIGGDSAGGTLVLSVLLCLPGRSGISLPALAILISPWITMVSTEHSNTSSDYLDIRTLHLYGSQYLRDVISPAEDELASPGNRRDVNAWKEATPEHGWIVTWGEQEVLRDDIRGWVARLDKAGVPVKAVPGHDSIHAWPVAALYLGESAEARLSGLRVIVEGMRKSFAGLLRDK